MLERLRDDVGCLVIGWDLELTGWWRGRWLVVRIAVERIERARDELAMRDDRTIE